MHVAFSRLCGVITQGTVLIKTIPISMMYDATDVRVPLRPQPHSCHDCHSFHHPSLSWPYGYHDPTPVTTPLLLRFQSCYSLTPAAIPLLPPSHSRRDPTPAATPLLPWPLYCHDSTPLTIPLLSKSHSFRGHFILEQKVQTVIYYVVMKMFLENIDARLTTIRARKWYHSSLEHFACVPGHGIFHSRTSGIFVNLPHAISHKPFHHEHNSSLRWVATLKSIFQRFAVKGFIQYGLVIQMHGKTDTSLRLITESGDVSCNITVLGLRSKSSKAPTWNREQAILCLFFKSICASFCSATATWWKPTRSLK
jgi:hypothetical protein